MNITVVGGGFGGVKTALELSKKKRNTITLITDRDTFQYYPALYSTATGGSHLQSWVPLGEIFAGHDNVTVVIDKIDTIDRKAKTITAASGETYGYQKLVLALGSVTTYFGIPGLDEYAFGIKSEHEIRELQQHLIRSFSGDAPAEPNIVIVGAGPTGVELASSLGEYLKKLKHHYKQRGTHPTITVVEAAPRVMPRMSEQASARIEARLKSLGVKVMLNEKVEAETADEIIISGKPIESHTVIWTSGVANNPFFAANEAQFTFSPNRKVVVDDHMRVDKDVYVIGDNAFTPFSGLAQTALHDALFVAKHISRDSKKKYKVVQPPVVIPVGEGWAMFEYKKLRFSGWLGALVRQAADFMGYKDVLPLGQALGVWRAQRIKQDTYLTKLPEIPEQAK